ncbi:MAG TPA: protein translocase subunit SecF, partial [Acidimicrobiales bacterium]
MTAPAAPKHSLFHRLYHGETEFDFVGRRRIGFIISLVLVAITLLSLFTRGLNFGLDFEGGVSWGLPASGLTTGEIESILADNGISPSTAKIQSLSGSTGDRFRIQVGPEALEGTQGLDRQQAVRDDLAKAAGIDQQEVNVESVSPTWGDEITKKAVRALVFFLIAIAAYISLRFEWRMAVGALVAVAHDVLISVGVYSVFQFEVTPATVVAFLTILGFSLYDTIVVFDKVHENTARLASGRFTYADIVNLSMNQVLMRS